MASIRENDVKHFKSDENISNEPFRTLHSRLPSTTPMWTYGRDTLFISGKEEKSLMASEVSLFLNIQVLQSVY